MYTHSGVHAIHYTKAHIVSRALPDHAVFRKTLEDRRRALGLSQMELAALAGVTQPTISRWLRGAWPEAQQLPGLARALQTTVDDLLTSGVPVSDQSRQEERAQGLWKRSRREDAEQPPKRKRGRG